MNRFLSLAAALLVSLGLSAQSLFPYQSGELWGYIDASGKTVVEPKYLYAGAFSEERAFVVNEYELVGFIDPTGKLAIEHQYAAVMPFTSGLASVMFNGEWKVIDKTGKVVLPGPYKEPLEFHDGLARINKGIESRPRWGFVDVTGKEVIAPQFAAVGDFHEGRALVRSADDYYGYIDKTGKLVVPYRYAYGFVMTMAGTPYFFESNFHDGVATVSLPEGGMLAIDPQGKVLLGKEAGIAGDYAEGLIPMMKDSLYGYIDITGKVVIEPQFLEAEEFSEGLAAVKTTEGGWGFVNAKGKLVVPGKFYGPTHPLFNPIKFEGGLAQVLVDPKRWAYVDKKGKVIWQQP